MDDAEILEYLLIFSDGQKKKEHLVREKEIQSHFID